MNLDKRLIQNAAAGKVPFYLTIGFSLVNGVLIIAQAWLLSRVINSVFLAGYILSDVMRLMFTLLAVILFRAAAVIGGETSASYVAIKIKTDLREQLFAHIRALGPANIQNEQTGELSLNAMEGIENLEAYFSQYLPQLILAALLPLIILFIVFPIDWLSGVVLLVTAPLMPLLMMLIGDAAQSLTNKQYGALSRLSGYFLDTLQGLTTLKMLGQSRAQVARVGKISDDYKQTTLKVLRVTFLSALVLEWLATISTAIVAVEIGIRLLYSRMPFEQALFILVLAPEFYMPLRMLGMRFHAGMSGVSAARRIFEILAIPVPVRPSQTSGIEPGESKYDIIFKDVHFTYPNRSRSALNGVSFRINAGQKTALVGASGSGKSTVAYLLLRFICPSTGQILIGNYPLEAFRLDAWREQIAWVSQTPYLFHDTLAANIRLARPQATEAEIFRAAALAHLDEFVQLLPLGYDTIIGEQGARLSGGQAQRLALARAFLKDSPFLILDEPTSSFDPTNEMLFQDSVNELAQGRTVLTIAHRLNTVYQADQIIVLSNGKVVEAGNHQHLLEQRGAYFRLVNTCGGESCV
jgi:ATP-binding cassette subfamily C protein CydD